MRHFPYGKQAKKIKLFSGLYASFAFLLLWYSCQDPFNRKIDLKGNIIHGIKDEACESNTEEMGLLKFHSGLIELPVVQGEDNSFYLKHDPLGNYNTKGSLFMDVRNRIDDPGIIIYGHTLYYDDQEMFSPLHRLRDQCVFEQNSTFALYMHQRHYEYVITHIVDMPVSDMEETALIRKANDDINEYRKFISYMDRHNLIQPSAQLTTKDDYLILFTCIEGKRDDRLLVTGKKVDIFPKEMKK